MSGFNESFCVVYLTNVYSDFYLKVIDKSIRTAMSKLKLKV